MSDTNIATHVSIVNYDIFLNYYWCRHVSEVSVLVIYRVLVTLFTFHFRGLQITELYAFIGLKSGLRE